MKKILVVGATGHLGMEVCRQLRGAGWSVSGLVRSSSSPDRITALRALGVQHVEGDLKDRSSVGRALKSIDTVISTASSTLSKHQGDSIQSVDNKGQSGLVDAAVEAGVGQFIYVSFPEMEGNFPLQDAKRAVEAKLKASGMTYTILQPTFFSEIWLSPAVGFDFPNAKATVYGDGKKKISWIAIRDVAAFAAASVGSAIAENKTIELGGPEALSPLEVIAIFEKASGRKFEINHVPVEALNGQLNGAPDDLSKSFAGLMLNYAAGSEIDMRKTSEDFSIKLNTVHEYANRVVGVREAV
jgi:uncharacterized protein YbjT (DUF2867 family)